MLATSQIHQAHVIRVAYQSLLLIRSVKACLCEINLPDKKLCMSLLSFSETLNNEVRVELDGLLLGRVQVLQLDLFLLNLL